jgi:hypothetical protein
MNTMKYLVGALLLGGALAAPACFADGDTDISITYAGTGFGLVDPDADGFSIGIMLTEAKGTFGKSGFTILYEFALDTDASVSCPAGDLPLDLVRNVAILTTANLDQLWGWFTGGYLCVSPDMTRWVGGASGNWIGGTGRFQQATGEWTSSYSGANFDLESGFETISGTLEGTIIEP